MAAKQFSGWNEERIKKLKEQGKIQGSISLKKPEKKKIQRGFKEIPQRSKEKGWLEWNLLYWANDHSVALASEHKFHPVRNWRFDWCFPALKIAVEYEGIFNKGKAHSSISGVMRDIEKYNEATVLGWKIIRVTANNYKTVSEKLNALHVRGNVDQ